MTSDPAIWLSTHRALSHLASSYATFRIGTREGPSARRVLRAAEACLSGLPRGRASAQQDLVEPQATLPQEVCSLFGRSAGLPAAPSAAGMCSAEWSAGHFFQQWLLGRLPALCPRSSGCHAQGTQAMPFATTPPWLPRI